MPHISQILQLYFSWKLIIISGMNNIIILYYNGYYNIIQQLSIFILFYSFLYCLDKKNSLYAFDFGCIFKNV